MAGGGLMQLVAYGAQDVYLSGNPQITFFKAVYKRHTNFSCEAITQTFSGSPDFGRRVTCPITRNGDLITKMYLVCKVTGSSTKKWAWTSQLGHAMIDNVELEVINTRMLFPTAHDYAEYYWSTLLWRESIQGLSISKVDSLRKRTLDLLSKSDEHIISKQMSCLVGNNKLVLLELPIL